MATKRKKAYRATSCRLSSHVGSYSFTPFAMRSWALGFTENKMHTWLSLNPYLRAFLKHWRGVSGRRHLTSRVMTWILPLEATQSSDLHKQAMTCALLSLHTK